MIDYEMGYILKCQLVAHIFPQLYKKLFKYKWEVGVINFPKTTNTIEVFIRIKHSYWEKHYWSKYSCLNTTTTKNSTPILMNEISINIYWFVLI